MNGFLLQQYLPHRQNVCYGLAPRGPTPDNEPLHPLLFPHEYGSGSINAQGEMTATEYRLKFEVRMNPELQPLDVSHILAEANGGANHVANFFLSFHGFNRSIRKDYDHLNAALVGLRRTEKALAASPSYRIGATARELVTWGIEDWESIGFTKLDFYSGIQNNVKYGREVTQTYLRCDKGKLRKLSAILRKRDTRPDASSTSHKGSMSQYDELLASLSALSMTVANSSGSSGNNGRRSATSELELLLSQQPESKPKKRGTNFELETLLRSTSSTSDRQPMSWNEYQKKEKGSGKRVSVVASEYKAYKSGFMK